MNHDEQILQQLAKFGPSNVYFLKSKWREWIKHGKLEMFENEARRPNVLTVYTVFNPKKIIYIEDAREGFFAVRTKHSLAFDIVVILRLADTRVEVMTYFKESTQRRKQP